MLTTVASQSETDFGLSIISLYNGGTSMLSCSLEVQLHYAIHASSGRYPIDQMYYQQYIGEQAFPRSESMEGKWVPLDTVSFCLGNLPVNIDVSSQRVLPVPEGLPPAITTS